MTIAERLRELAREFHQHRPHYTEAADEIERLEKENESLANANLQMTINHEVMLDAGRKIEQLQAALEILKAAVDKP